VCGYIGARENGVWSGRCACSRNAIGREAGDDNLGDIAANVRALDGDEPYITILRRHVIASQAEILFSIAVDTSSVCRRGNRGCSTTRTQRVYSKAQEVLAFQCVICTRSSTRSRE
jgi:hypothetical protein